MVSFEKHFRTSVARQVSCSRKVKPLSTSATARNGRGGEKQEFHRVTPLRETGLAQSCCAVAHVSAKRLNAYQWRKRFMVLSLVT